VTRRIGKYTVQKNAIVLLSHSIKDRPEEAEERLETGMGDQSDRRQGKGRPCRSP